jgi:hypothetical protein
MVAVPTYAVGSYVVCLLTNSICNNSSVRHLIDVSTSVVIIYLEVSASTFRAFFVSHNLVLFSAAKLQNNTDIRKKSLLNYTQTAINEAQKNAHLINKASKFLKVFAELSNSSHIGKD